MASNEINTPAIKVIAMARKTKRLLRECIHHQRQQKQEEGYNNNNNSNNIDNNYCSLYRVAEPKLLSLVGPRHWNRSVHYLNLYLQKMKKT